MARKSTNAPGRTVVLYDGHCRFCSSQVDTLRKMARKGAIDPVSFQDEGVLEQFPGVTYDECMRAMQLVTPDGRVYSGFEAAVRAVATRRVLGKLAFIYYVPIIKQLCDLVYWVIARNRYRLAGKQPCEDGTCSIHAEHTQSKRSRERTAS